MKTIKISILCLVIAFAAFGQTATTTTTLSSSINQSQNTIVVASATGIVASAVGADQLVMINKEVMKVTAVASTTLTVQRGVKGTGASAHATLATVWAGPPSVFLNSDPVRGSTCTAANQPYLPVISVSTGTVWNCTNLSTWGQDMIQYISPTDCTFAPTTSTVTNTYPQVGASTLFVLNGTTNSAAGTTTLTCNILLPTKVGTSNGLVLSDITLFIGSQTTAPTSLGTSTLGSITFPAAATTETASTVTPVAVGGTVTTTSPTLITTITTAGSFLTIKHTYASAVRLSTDRQILQYTMPFLQSAAAVMTLNTPGLLVHYIAD